MNVTVLLFMLHYFPKRVLFINFNKLVTMSLKVYVKDENGQKKLWDVVPDPEDEDEEEVIEEEEPVEDTDEEIEDEDIVIEDDEW